MDAHHQHVSAMERGVMLPTLMTVLRLALTLKCKASALVSAFDGADLARSSRTEG